MAFLTKDDYVNISAASLAIVQQSDDAKRAAAEAAAQEEIASYLRPQYDVTAIFAASGEKRNNLIVMLYCDIALYHLICSLPQKMGYDLRKERYDNAVQKLKDIQAGKCVPDLPVKADDTDPNRYNSIQYNGGNKNEYFW